MQQLIEEELTAAIGAAPQEHSESRTNWRNGHRYREASTDNARRDVITSFWPASCRRETGVRSTEKVPLVARLGAVWRVPAQRGAAVK